MVPNGITAKAAFKRAVSQGQLPDFNPRTKMSETRVRGVELESLFDAVPFWLIPVRVAPVLVLAAAAEELGNLNGKRNLKPPNG
jgi:hypothetical protein